MEKQTITRRALRNALGSISIYDLQRFRTILENMIKFGSKMCTSRINPYANCYNVYIKRLNNQYDLFIEMNIRDNHIVGNISYDNLYKEINNILVKHYKRMRNIKNKEKK